MLPIVQIYAEHQSLAKICRCCCICKGYFPKHNNALIQYGRNIESMIKGHSDCGAIALSMYNVMLEYKHTANTKIQQVAINGGNYLVSESANQVEIYEIVTKDNTRNSINDILVQSPYLKAKVEAK